MAVQITITNAGANISSNLDINYTTDYISWVYLTTQSLVTLQAGYAFIEPMGALAYQVVDSGLCQIVLELDCITTTTTSTIPASTTTTTTGTPSTTTTSTTQDQGYGLVDPTHIQAPPSGGNYFVNLVYPDAYLALTGVADDAWLTPSIDPTVYIYSPGLNYNVMTVVVDVNTGSERISTVNVYDGGLNLFGWVTIRQSEATTTTTTTSP
jgi:hypothetical protein